MDIQQKIKEFEAKTELTSDQFFDLARLYRVFERNVFSPDIEIEEENPIVWVESQGEKHLLAYPGGMYLVIGKYKSRKTVILNAIVSCILGIARILGFSSNQQGKNVLYFDTEQRKGDVWRTQKRILYDAKTGRMPKNYRCIFLREFNHKERQQIINDTIMHEEALGRKPDFVFIDGLLDLVKDPNDYVENNEMVEMLMKISAKGITMFMVIHLSNTGTIHGHTGSVLAKKVDGAIEVEQKVEGKDDNGKPILSKEISIISNKFTRGTMPFPEFEIFQEKEGKIKRLDLKEDLIPYNPIITISGKDAIRNDNDIPFN